MANLAESGLPVPTFDDLVSCAQQGDEGAVDQLLGGLQLTFYGIAWHILRDVQYTEDAVQLALMAVWQALPSIEPARQPRGFCLRICRNAAIDLRRKIQRGCGEIFGRDNEGLGRMIEQVIDQSRSPREVIEEQEQLHSWIESALSPAEKELVRLRCEESLTFARIAKSLDLAVGTVHGKWEAVLEKLRRQAYASEG